MRQFSFPGGVELTKNLAFRALRTKRCITFADTDTLLAHAAMACPLIDKTKLRRSSQRSLQTAALCAFALLDANIISCDPMQTCMIGIGHSGCHEENLVYWKDYCSNGHIDGRGHFFVGTLATTPLCETAIALGIHGSVFYLDPGTDDSALRSELSRLLLFEKQALALVCFDDGSHIKIIVATAFHPSIRNIPISELESIPGGALLLR